MSFFQNSVINKYIKALDKQVVSNAYAKFKEHFHNSASLRSSYPETSHTKIIVLSLIIFLKNCMFSFIFIIIYISLL